MESDLQEQPRPESAQSRGAGHLQPFRQGDRKQNIFAEGEMMKRIEDEIERENIRFLRIEEEHKQKVRRYNARRKVEKTISHTPIIKESTK